MMRDPYRSGTCPSSILGGCGIPRIQVDSSSCKLRSPDIIQSQFRLTDTSDPDGIYAAPFTSPVATRALDRRRRKFLKLQWEIAGEK